MYDDLHFPDRCFEPPTCHECGTRREDGNELIWDSKSKKHTCEGCIEEPLSKFIERIKKEEGLSNEQASILLEGE